MHNRFFRLFLLAMATLSLLGCSDNDSEDNAVATNVVEVVFSPSGFGDLGYNDIILTGRE